MRYLCQLRKKSKIRIIEEPMPLSLSHTFNAYFFARAPFFSMLSYYSGHFCLLKYVHYINSIYFDKKISLTYVWYIKQYLNLFVMVIILTLISSFTSWFSNCLNGNTRHCILLPTLLEFQWPYFWLYWFTYFTSI